MSMLSSVGPSLESETRPALAPAPVRALNSEVTLNSLSDDYSMREAVLLTFCDPLPDQCLRLVSLSEVQWKKLLNWLDISGLALYFLDRIQQLELTDLLPPRVLARLQQNQRDNNVRTIGMAAESVAIQKEFQAARISYATVKGFSLSPYSVPKPELRHQFDLDFLIAEQSVAEARQILEGRGYRLYAISGRSWEFKINETPGVSITDLYKDLPGRSVELHVEVTAPGRPSLLGHTETRDFCDISMPVLSDVDLFLGQGLHAYKHLNGEFSRAAHLLEFRRHVLFRRDDDAFWRELQSTVDEDPRACLGLGVVTQLITNVMGDFAPEALIRIAVRPLSPAAKLWIELYGRRAVLQSFPGSKLYLLLQGELESAHVPGKRSLRQALFPSRLPPSLIQASGSESVTVRLRRYRLQLHHIFSRLRFHIVEGLRYIRESYRWRQHLNRLTR